MNSRVSEIVIYSLATLALITAFCLSFRPERVGFTEDMGLSAAVAESILDGHSPILGPPSHTGGRHLGPIGYWYVAAAIELAGHNLFLAFFLIGLTELLAAIGICFFIRELVPDFQKTSAFLFSILCCGGTLFFESFIYPWHNHFLIVMSTFFLFSVWQGLKGKSFGYALMALSGSLLAQFHYSSLPLVGLCFLWVLVQRYLDKKLKEPGNFIFNCALFIVTVASWLPLFGYEIQYPGTIRQTLFPHAANGGFHAGLREAVSEVFGTLKNFTLGNDFIPPLFEHHRWKIVIGMYLLGTFFFAICKKKDRYSKSFVLLCVTSLILYTGILAWLSPPLFPSYLYTLFPVFLLFVGLSLSSALSTCFSNRSIWIRIAAALFVSVWSLGILREFYGRLAQEQFLPLSHSFAHAQKLIGIVKKDGGDNRVTFRLVAGSSFMHGVYLYFLGPEYFREIEYWNLIPELPQKPTPKPTLLYQIGCPRPTGNFRREIEASLKDEGWEKGDDLDLSSCPICKGCMVRRYGSKN